MNCKELEGLINDLARSRMMDAALRESVYAHTSDCAVCASRLAEEKQLTVGLRALAILDENKKASQTTEAHLLNAFRKRNEAARATAAPHNVESLSSLSTSAPANRLRKARWAMAVAAMILLMLALIAWRIQNPHKEAAAVGETATQSQPKQVEQNPKKEGVANPPAPMPNNPALYGKIPDQSATKRPERKTTTKDLGRMNQRLASDQTNHKPSKPLAQPAQEEIATSFISLTQGYTLPMSEGGQVVRVELPRSALASFGLPVNAQRLNEPVKADVVVGNDGIARAIRFVR
jgi:hypothetical protein